MKKQTKILCFLFILSASILALFPFWEIDRWETIDKKALPEKISEQQLITVLDNEKITYRFTDEGNLQTPRSELSKTELLLTGLRAIESLQQEHSSQEVIGELLIQRYVNEKINGLMDSIVGKGAYISEVYISPAYNFLPIKRGIPAEDLLTYFLNSPGVKRVYFRLVIDSDTVKQKELDPAFIEARVKRHLRSILHELKGVRLTEEIMFTSFNGTGLNTLANNEVVRTNEEKWVSKLLIPMFIGALFIIIWLVLLVLEQKKKQNNTPKIESLVSLEKEFQSIQFPKEKDNTNNYLQLHSLPSGLIETFTDSGEIGTILLILHPKEAAAYLNMLSFEQQVKAIAECMKYIGYGDADREAMVNKAFQLLKTESSSLETSLCDGVAHIARILNELQPVLSKQILQELHQVDSIALIRLKNEFFVQTTLYSLSAAGIWFILDKGYGLDLLLAVYHSDSPIRKKIIELVPERTRIKMARDSSKIDPMKIQAAQLRIAKLIAQYERKLVQDKYHFQNT